MAKLQILRLSHVYYKHADINKQTKFLEDFGMHHVETIGKKHYYAGTGKDAYCFISEEADASSYEGGAFLMESRDELVRATKVLPNASAIQSLDGPGGGEVVYCRDPNGLPFQLVHGIKEKSIEPQPPVPEANFPTEKQRKGEFRRFEKGPSPVFKLGHFGLLVQDFQKQYEFFTQNFNLVASDILTAPNDMPVASFLHIDRGADYSDHHSFFFSLNKRNAPHHCSFEVHDADVQAIGHEWLQKQGYTPSWGIGRHVLGSQIFDYWYMPDNFMIEHYSDGDLVNNTYKTDYLPAGPGSLMIYGPAVPEGFNDAIPKQEDLPRM